MMLALLLSLVLEVPGAINPQVTQENIHTTVCVPGWTRTVRPPVSFTTAVKRQQIHDWSLLGTTADYEEDHRVPLEAGGDPGAVPREIDQMVNGLLRKLVHWLPTTGMNLWAEPWVARGDEPGAHEKDHLENAVHRDLCAGLLTLAQAQAVFLGDWRAELKRRFPNTVKP